MFSTKNCWPRLSESFCATRRAMTSVGPPGGNPVEDLSKHLYATFFEPGVDTPLKTLDVPLGGSVSPVDALSLLIEYLTIAGTTQAGGTKLIDKYDDDGVGDETIKVLKNALLIVQRMTGNSDGGMGLHPAVYFYNERGKYSRFL